LNLYKWCAHALAVSSLKANGFFGSVSKFRKKIEREFSLTRENVERFFDEFYCAGGLNFNYFSSMITNDERRTREIKARIGTAKAAFSRKMG
jgi:hypothetical protein